MNRKTNTLVKMALLSAMALILRYIEFPILPLFPWLQIDFSDVPALICGFGFGPLAGIVVELLKNTLIVVIKGTSTGFVGELANFLVGVALILPVSLLYYKKRSKKTFLLGIILSLVFMELLAIVTNIYLLLPIYGMHMSSSKLLQYVIYGLIPFNGIKAVLVSIVTYLIYPRISNSVFNDKTKFSA